MAHKKNIYKYMKWSILGILLIGVAFLATAYVNGKTVVNEDFSLQWVSHTEYWREDYASTIVRLSDYKGTPLMADECRVTILYPDKTIFIDNQPLSQSTIAGNWYRTDYLANAPLHLRGKFVNVNLSKELRKKEEKRSMRIRKGDTVKIMRGKYNKKQGKVLSVDLKKTKISVEGIQIKKQDGSKVNVKMRPSNLQIVELAERGKVKKVAKETGESKTKVEVKKIGKEINSESKTKSKIATGDKK